MIKKSKNEKLNLNSIPVLQPWHIATWPQGTNAVLISFSKQIFGKMLRKKIKQNR